MSEASIDELLDAIDMESYLDREGIQYKIAHGSSGTQLNVRECPVCGSNGWKVYLNADTGLGNCFAGDHPSGENYSKWSFIRAHIGADTPRKVVDHLKSVAREMGWRARKTTSVEVNIERPDLVLPESYAIPINGSNLRYLAERNIDTGTAKYFNLRYSNKGVFWYRDHNGEVRHQRYDKRIIIPIFDMDGELVSFQGRDITGEAEKKYLFPPGFSSTGRYLYNGHNARGAKSAVINEGVFDVMATKIALDGDVELRHVVQIGTFGKHLSNSMACKDQLGEFIKLRDAGLKEVVFMWDSEARAIHDAVDAALLLGGIGLSVRLAILPPGKDPNEVSPQTVRDAYWQAIPVNKRTAVKIKLEHKR